jgi:hypothetical protein
MVLDRGGSPACNSAWLNPGETKSILGELARLGSPKAGAGAWRSRGEGLEGKPEGPCGRNPNEGCSAASWAWGLVSLTVCVNPTKDWESGWPSACP